MLDLLCSSNRRIFKEGTQIHNVCVPAGVEGALCVGQVLYSFWFELKIVLSSRQSLFLQQHHHHTVRRSLPHQDSIASHIHQWHRCFQPRSNRTYYFIRTFHLPHLRTVCLAVFPHFLQHQIVSMLDFAPDARNLGLGFWRCRSLGAEQDWLVPRQKLQRIWLQGSKT